jgi:hypothetical protein
MSNLDVRNALRMSNSGEFIHAAPWSVASQGVANVSHGCGGMSTANARWLRAGLTVRRVESLSLQRFSVPMFARWFATAHAETGGLDRSQLQPRTRWSATIGGWTVRLGLIRDKDQTLLRNALAGVFAERDVLLTPEDGAALAPA